jgi:thiol-disulfide isomerase/thioredoxin
VQGYDSMRRLRNFLLVAAALLLVVIFGPRMCQSRLLAPGTAAPAFSFVRIGAPGRLTLGELRGKPAVLFFWAAWCPSCKEMLPGLAALAKERPGVPFVAVHADATVTVAAIAQRARQYPSLVFVEEGERMLGPYRVGTFPTTYVIDAAGRICGGFVGRTSGDAIAVLLDRCGGG